MTAAEQADERDREVRRIVRQIEPLLPEPLEQRQRLRFEEAVAMNIAGVGG